MASLFGNGFDEGDFSAWTGSGQNGTNALASVTAGSKYAGPYGASLTSGDSGAGANFALVWKDITVTTDYVSLEAKIKLVTAGQGGIFEFMELWRLATLDAYILNLINFVGTYQFNLRGKDGVAQSANLPAFNTGQWYTVRLVYDARGANPIGRCLIDGIERATITDVTAGTLYVPDRARLIAWEVFPPAQIAAYVDDVSVHDLPPISYPGVMVSRFACPNVLARVLR